LARAPRLAAFYFAFFVYVGLFAAYFPPYLAARGLDVAEIAWVLALPQLARVFAPAFWGWLADRSQRARAIIAFSCAANTVAFALVPVVSGFAPLAALVGLASLLSAGALPLVEAITLGALSGSPGRYGPIRLWGSIGFIAAVMAGGTWLDFRSVHVLPAAIALVSLAGLVAALNLPGRQAAAASTAPPVQISSPALLLLASSFCMATAHGTLYAFLTLHLQRVGYRGSTIGLLWTLGVVAEVFVFLLLPALFRRWRLSTIMIGSAACGIVRFLLIGWAAESPLVLAFAQLLHGATFGSFHAAAVAAVHRLFVHAQARGQALFSSVAYGAGGAAGALAGGWAWESGGPGLAFSVSAVAAAAGVFLAYPLKREGL